MLCESQEGQIILLHRFFAVCFTSPILYCRPGDGFGGGLPGAVNCLCFTPPLCCSLWVEKAGQVVRRVWGGSTIPVISRDPYI